MLQLRLQGGVLQPYLHFHTRQTPHSQIHRLRLSSKSVLYGSHLPPFLPLLEEPHEITQGNFSDWGVCDDKRPLHLKKTGNANNPKLRLARTVEKESAEKCLAIKSCTVNGERQQAKEAARTLRLVETGRGRPEVVAHGRRRRITAKEADGASDSLRARGDESAKQNIQQRATMI